jgi:hypothetical protein
MRFALAISRRWLDLSPPQSSTGMLATAGAVSAALPSDLSSYSANRKRQMTE